MEIRNLVGGTATVCGPDVSLAHAAAVMVDQGIGSLGIVDGLSAPGKRLALRAEMDTLVLISNCPQINNPCNGFDPTPVRMVVTRP